MRFSYNTFNRSAAWGLPPSLPQQVRAAAEAGYDAVGIDLPSVEAHLTGGVSLDALAHALLSSGLPCHELVWLTVSEDGERTSRDVERALPIVEALEPEQVLVVATDTGHAAADNLDRCAARLFELGARTAVEFLAGRPLGSLADALALTAEVSAEVGVVIDLWHFHHGSDTFDALAEVNQRRIGFIQLCDVVEPRREDLDVEMMHRRAMPGEGMADLGRFCAAVAHTGYDGVISVEVLSEQWRTGDLDAFLRRSLDTSRAAWRDAVEDPLR